MTPSKSRDQKLMEQQDRISEMRDQQSSGSVPTITPNKSIPTLTPPVPSAFRMIRTDAADGYVHVFTRNKHIQPSGKDFAYEDSVAQIHKAEFDRKVAEGYFQLCDEVYVIHDPRDADRTYTAAELKPGKAQIDTKPLDLTDKASKARLQQQALQLEKEAFQVARQKEDVEKKAAALAEREANLDALEKALNGKQAQLAKLSEDDDTTKKK